MNVKIAPSLLSADFGDLKSDIQMLNKSQADWLHLDIMDGVFVPNISFVFPVLIYVKDLSEKPLDVHLMITEPTKIIKEEKDHGADIMNIHYEAVTNLHRAVEQMKAADMKAGITLNPATPVCLLEDIICDVDMILLMSVNPGFGGQKFIENSIQKCERLKEMILRKGAHAMIEVDGGINLETGKIMVNAGADILVAGNYIFKSEDPVLTIENMKKL